MREAVEATSSQVPVRRRTVPPVVAARWVLWTFVIANLAIVEVLFLNAGTGQNGVLTVAKLFARLDDASMLKIFFALAGVPASLLGMVAAALVVVVASVSARKVRRRLRQETWHGLHLLM
ncbi:hypothetical protein [Streptomyces sp. NPDC093568]|uniref:hypothetical protein n=1 Tax=Streptomyces sp. NPDC093568 TaxID=3366041 RepID=UPI003823432B